MVIFSKSSLGIAAGIAGTLFLGYCIYFDNKRRHDPDYKKKVRARRQALSAKGGESPRMTVVNFNDPQAIERYFMQQIHLGEKCIAMKNIESGVEHLANATLVCDDPTRLLNVLQGTLPQIVFVMLVERLRQRQAIKKTHSEVPLQQKNGAVDQKPPTQATLIDDLE